MPQRHSVNKNFGLPYSPTYLCFVPKPSPPGWPARDPAGLRLQGPALGSLLALQAVSALKVFLAALVFIAVWWPGQSVTSEDPSEESVFQGIFLTTQYKFLKKTSSRVECKTLLLPLLLKKTPSPIYTFWETKVQRNEGMHGDRE